MMLSFNLGDATDNSWATCFQDQGEKMLGVKSDELGHFLENDEEKYNAVFTEATFKTCSFLGACNTTTDIKEANFLGQAGSFVMAGSDDGRFFIWDRRTGNIVRVLAGDESIVNCLQAHPATPLLATSGIDPVVRLWEPGPEDGVTNSREVADREAAADSNQQRMNADPFELILRNIGGRGGLAEAAGEASV